jgi:DNA-binding CsgD family transcriptional regulator
VTGNGLTAREYAVARLVARGLTNREVARKLGLADGTVKIHVHHVLQKLGEKKRSALWFKGRTFFATARSGWCGKRKLRVSLLGVGRQVPELPLTNRLPGAAAPRGRGCGS